MTEGFTDEQKEHAATLASEVRALIDSNRDLKTGIETNFVEIGSRLSAIRAGRYWKLMGFRTFTEFMESLESRTQNYHCMGVARDLLPYVSKDDLAAMGITKATALRLLVKGGKVPTPELVDLAKKSTKEELEGEIAKILGLVEDEEKGQWFSYGGARLSDEEREEFLATVNAAVKAGAVESEEIKNWQEVPSMKKKPIMHVICAEFLSTYAAA